SCPASYQNLLQGWFGLPTHARPPRATRRGALELPDGVAYSAPSFMYTYSTMSIFVPASLESSSSTFDTLRLSSFTNGCSSRQISESILFILPLMIPCRTLGGFPRFSACLAKISSCSLRNSGLTLSRERNRGANAAAWSAQSKRISFTLGASFTVGSPREK